MVMDVDSISDAELKAQLKAFGQDVPPVNDATRSTLKRRLAKLAAASPNTLSNSMAKGGSVPRSDSPFRRTRQTPPAGPSGAAARTPSPPIVPLPRLVQPSVSPRRGGRSGAAFSSDEEEEETSSCPLRRPTNVTAGSPVRGNTNGQLWGSISSTVTGGESSGSSSNLTKDTGFSRWFNSQAPKTSTPTDSRSSVRLQESFGALTPIRDREIRPRHPLGRPPLGTFDNVDSEVTSKSSGGFLGALFGSSKADDSLSGSSQARDARNVRHSPPRPRPLQFLGRSRTEDGGWASSWVSWLLVLATLAFFAFVAVTYIAIHWNASPTDTGIVQYQMEGRSEADKLYQVGEYEAGLIPGRGDGQKFYNPEETLNALNIASALSKELARLKGETLCGDLIKNTMGVTEARSFALSAVPNTQNVDFGNAVDLIVANPHWGIRAMDTNRNAAETASDVKSFESEYAAKGFLCRMREAVATMLFKIVTTVFLVALTTAAAFALRKYLQRRTQHQEMVYDMVNKIITLVQKNHEKAMKDPHVKPYLAVSHVRETLVPHGRERSHLLTVFNDAVQYIEGSESRLRMETQPLNGEDFEVWTWTNGRDTVQQPDSTEPDTPSSSRASADSAGVSRSKDRTWTGGASKDTRPELLSAATPCLKVRGFFNGKNENQRERSWVEEIEDAIMERCHGVARIVDMKVEPTSEEGVVYIKLLSNEDARNAYLAMHGQYFDNTLVNVKFLKLDRYHQRFPETVNKTSPLSHKKK